MDFKNLKPDFGAISQTQWGKPQFDKKNPVALAGTIAAALMLIFLFFSWFTISKNGASAGRLGISLWYGWFGLVGALAAIVGNLYNQKPLAFCGGALGVIMGAFGWFITPSVSIAGTTLSASAIKSAGYDVSHTGAILFLLASAVVAVCAYLSVNKSQK